MEGFEWINGFDADSSTISFIRKGKPDNYLILFVILRLFHAIPIG